MECRFDAAKEVLFISCANKRGVYVIGNPSEHFQEAIYAVKWGPCSCFLPFLLSMSSGDSDYQRLSSVSGRGPKGPTELVLCWYSISAWGLETIPSTFFSPFF